MGGLFIKLLIISDSALVRNLLAVAPDACEAALGAVSAVPEPRPFGFPVLERALGLKRTVVPVPDPRPLAFSVLDLAPSQPFIHYPQVRDKNADHSIMLAT